MSGRAESDALAMEDASAEDSRHTPRLAPTAPRARALLSAPLDPERVAAIADYGAPPSGLIGSAIYAAVVWTRRRALRATIRDLRRFEASAERDLDESLSALGSALHSSRAEEGTLERELANADDAARAAGQRAEEREEAQRATEAQREALDAKIAQAERESDPHRDRETKLATQMETRETDLRRARARLSRVEIQLRNLASQPDEASREALEAERMARSEEVEAARAQVDELARQLAEARRALAGSLAAINALRAERRALEASDSQLEKAHAEAASDAERAYQSALRALAARALELELADAIAPELSSDAQRMQSALATRQREVAHHEAALAAYDPRSLKRGAALLMGAALLVLLTLVLAIVR